MALNGVVPIEDTHSGNFVILQEPLKDGDIGSGLISGVCPVSIDVSNSTHKFADVAEGQTANLKSGPFGAAQILWKESGTGLKWAVVQMGLPAGYRDFVAKITNVGPNSEADFNTALYWVKEYYVAWNPNINPPGDPVVSQTMYLYEMPGGRHVPAYAMDEFGAYLQHSLPTDSTVAVIVHEMLSPAQNPPFYVFTGPSIIVAGA